jgi:hypothetical protein
MFALYRSGYGVFGTGETEEQARADARLWLDDPQDAERAELSVHRHEEIEGELYVRCCTDRLFDAVRERGGQLPLTINGYGKLDLDEDED